MVKVVCGGAVTPMPRGVPPVLVPESWIVPAVVAVPETEYWARPPPGHWWKVMEPVTWAPSWERLTVHLKGSSDSGQGVALVHVPAKLVTDLGVGVGVTVGSGISVGVGGLVSVSGGASGAGG